MYHEGAARKVFPCTICKKEFSRPDKMKQHLKQAHEGGGGGAGANSSSKDNNKSNKADQPSSGSAAGEGTGLPGAAGVLPGPVPVVPLDHSAWKF